MIEEDLKSDMTVTLALCVRCGAPEPEDKHFLSVYGFCEDCHKKFVPHLRRLIGRFINEHKTAKLEK